jgi:TolA-binding protein
MAMFLMKSWSPVVALRAGVLPLFPSRRIVVSLLLFSLVSLSCAVTEFVGAYFNTYYNAHRLFSEAEAEVFVQTDSRPGGRSYLVPFAIQSGTRTKLVGVIEKGSKLLQYHPESSLVDDALMMIGKSYFYSDEDQKAERKFREVIDGFPNGGLALEARLLLACGEYRMNRKKEASETARAVIEQAEKEGEDEFLSRAYALLARLEFEEKNFGNAADLYGKAAEHATDSEQRAGLYILVADMDKRLEKYRDAEIAFALAQKSSQLYSGEFRGRIGVLRMRAKQGEYGAAIEGLRQLRGNSNNREFYGEIELEIAHCYRASGDIPAALNYYNFVDTSYGRTEVASRSYFAKGEIYEKTLFLYDSALVAYTRGRMEFPAADVQGELSVRADYLGRYFGYQKEIVRYDSIRALLLMPVDSAVHAPDSSAARGEGVDTVRVAVWQRPAITLDSVMVRLASAKNELGGLFYATIGIPDSAGNWYRRVIAEHPESPHVPRALFTLAQIYSRDSLASHAVADSLYGRLIAQYPESDFSTEARRILRLPPVRKKGDEAEGLYLRAEKLMMAGNTSAALDSFKTLVRRYPASPFASRALYAAGWLYESQNARIDSALATYERLAKLYPASPYAVSLQPRLAAVRMERAEALTRAAQDSTARATIGLPKQTPVDDEGAAARKALLLKKPVIPPPPGQQPGQKPPEGKEGPTQE